MNPVITLSFALDHPRIRGKRITRQRIDPFHNLLSEPWLQRLKVPKRLGSKGEVQRWGPHKTLGYSAFKLSLQLIPSDESK